MNVILSIVGNSAEVTNKSFNEFWVGTLLPLTFREDMNASSPPHTVIKNGPLTNYEIDANFKLLESEVKKPIPPPIGSSAMDYGLLKINYIFNSFNRYTNHVQFLGDDSNVDIDDIYGEVAIPYTTITPSMGPSQFYNQTFYVLQRREATHNMFMFGSKTMLTDQINLGIYLRPDLERDFPIGSWFILNYSERLSYFLEGPTILGGPGVVIHYPNNASSSILKFTDGVYHWLKINPSTYSFVPKRASVICIKTAPNTWEVNRLNGYMVMF